MSSMPEHSLSPGAPQLGSKGESRRQRILASEDIHLQPDPGLVAEEVGPSMLPAAVLGHSGVLRF